MTQTYDPAWPILKDRIRFEIADTDVADGQAFLDDEEIESILTLHSNAIGLSVLSGIDNIIGQLSRPGYRVDGVMQVTAVVLAANSYRKLRDQKEKEFGLDTTVSFSSSTTYTTRQDGYGG